MAKLETALIHEGEHFNTTNSVVTPIYQTSTYIADDMEAFALAATTTKSPEFYHRHGNPNNSQGAAVIAKLEKTEDALILATGMAAISSAILAVVKAGDHIVAQQAHYAASLTFFREFLAEYGVEVTQVDQTDKQAFEAAIKPNTKLIFVETPSNPNLDITDLKHIADLGKERGILTMIDNTFASPINQVPADFGIDIIVHSATKYLGGHSDLTAGAVCGSRAYIEQVWRRSLLLGASLSPFDSWLLLRGLKTLALRVRQINENTLALAQWLENQNVIKKVTYVGLPSHPQHTLAKVQMKGFTGMLTIEVDGQDDTQQFERAQNLLKHLQIFQNAVSLGGVESLICHPASMWTAHQKAGQAPSFSRGLLRISVGIEHIDDLINDLDQAFRQL